MFNDSLFRIYRTFKKDFQLENYLCSLDRLGFLGMFRSGFRGIPVEHIKRLCELRTLGKAGDECAYLVTVVILKYLPVCFR